MAAMEAHRSSPASAAVNAPPFRTFRLRRHLVPAGGWARSLRAIYPATTRARLHSSRRQNGGPTTPLVNAAKVKRATAANDLALPGTITPIMEAYMFARASGYLAADMWILATACARISCWGNRCPRPGSAGVPGPGELAQAESQLGQAEATLEQLISTRDLAAITWERYKVLTATGAVSRQDRDIQLTAAKTSEANVTAGRKSRCARRRKMCAPPTPSCRGYSAAGIQRITAPFAGIITARNVDVGALISATGASQGPKRSIHSAPSDLPSSGEIFRVAEIS